MMRAERSADWVQRVPTVLWRGLDHPRKDGLTDNPANVAARGLTTGGQSASISRPTTARISVFAVAWSSELTM